MGVRQFGHVSWIICGGGAAMFELYPFPTQRAGQAGARQSDYEAIL
jgi:hypothetical protein